MKKEDVTPEFVSQFISNKSSEINIRERVETEKYVPSENSYIDVVEFTADVKSHKNVDKKYGSSIPYPLKQNIKKKHRWLIVGQADDDKSSCRVMSPTEPIIYDSVEFLVGSIISKGKCENVLSKIDCAIKKGLKKRLENGFEELE